MLIYDVYGCLSVSETRTSKEVSPIPSSISLFIYTIIDDLRFDQYHLSFSLPSEIPLPNLRWNILLSSTVSPHWNSSWKWPLTPKWFISTYLCGVLFTYRTSYVSRNVPISFTGTHLRHFLDIFSTVTVL